MSETPQAQQRAAEVPPQTRGQEQTAPEKTAPAPQHRAEVTPTKTSGWVGWVVFGSMMMIMVGAFQVILGLTALLNSDYYIAGSNGLVVNVDYTAWGWGHLALGVVTLAAAFGLLTGSMWARVLGIAVAMVGALVNLAFIAAFPVWCITVITLDVLVIYAIAVHGGELKDA